MGARGGGRVRHRPRPDAGHVAGRPPGHGRPGRRSATGPDPAPPGRGLRRPRPDPDRAPGRVPGAGRDRRRRRPGGGPVRPAAAAGGLAAVRRHRADAAGPVRGRGSGRRAQQHRLRHPSALRAARLRPVRVGLGALVRGGHLQARPGHLPARLPGAGRRAGAHADGRRHRRPTPGRSRPAAGSWSCRRAPRARSTASPPSSPSPSPSPDPRPTSAAHFRPTSAAIMGLSS